MVKKIGLIFLFLTGCAVSTPVLDTNAKRLVAAEVTYGEITTLALNSKDRLSASSREDVKQLLLDAHTALVAARAALNLGNDLDFSTSLSTANSIIRTLRPILEALEEEEEKEAKNEWSIKSDSFA
jgi:hypothetical protein